MVLKAPRGTKDILPEEAIYFQFLEDTARSVFGRWGYEELRTPIFESTELFCRGVGEETDIVSKEMYTFEDRKGRSLTLRPEGTAPVVRAMIEHNLLKQQGVRRKVFYTGAMFRYERPQAGRQRQFSQGGVEFFGCDSPLADAELIAMLSAYLQALGFENTQVKINTIGNETSRQAYNAKLRQCLADVSESLCADCRRRAETNPMRTLDCKEKDCQAVIADFPPLSDFLDDESREHYQSTLRVLKNLDVSFVEDPMLVRGFDYYTHTVFEICLEGLGAQDAVLGGGRFDGLVELLGGPSTPALGAAFGLERLIMAMKAVGIAPPDSDSKSRTYVQALDESCIERAMEVAHALRQSGVPVRFDLAKKSFKAGLKAAIKNECAWMVVIGEEELDSGQVLVKNLDGARQVRVSLDRLISASTFHDLFEETST